jgi:hypothetical protein
MESDRCRREVRKLAKLFVATYCLALRLLIAELMQQVEME